MFSLDVCHNVDYFCIVNLKFFDMEKVVIYHNGEVFKTYSDGTFMTFQDALDLVRILKNEDAEYQNLLRVIKKLEAKAEKLRFRLNSIYKVKII